MIIKVYSVKDELIGFSQPFYAPSNAVAIRSFQGSAQSEKPNIVNTNPEDKSLWFVGEFDDQSGSFTNSLERIARAEDFIIKEDQA